MRTKIVWRNGVHIEGTPIWCDASHVREVCFVSGPDRFHAPHGQLIATPESIAMTTGTARRNQSLLTAGYGRPFSLGAVRMELVRSGHCMGGASMLVELNGERVFYAGRVNPQGIGLGGRADVRRCDVLILDATYGHPQYAFPDPLEAVKQLWAFITATVEAGKIPILITHTVSKALDVAWKLPAENIRIHAHRTVYEAAKRIGSFASIPPLRCWKGRASLGDMVLCPLNYFSGMKPDRLEFETRIVLISGEANSSRACCDTEADFGCVWSSRGDYHHLHTYVEQSQASRVFVTGRYARSFAQALCRKGRTATVLEPPRQMNLFHAS